jgi:hypothetical protein
VDTFRLRWTLSPLRQTLSRNGHKKASNLLAFAHSIEFLFR